MPGAIRGHAGHLDIKRRLRSNMTGPETRLMAALRARQLHGMKFRRQHGIGPYIVDFYSPEQSLIIELDGDSHADADQIVKDQLRNTYFQSIGLRVIRYFNDDIVSNLAGVLEELAEKLALGSTSPHPSLPRRGQQADGYLSPLTTSSTRRPYRSTLRAPMPDISNRAAGDTGLWPAMAFNVLS